MVPIVFENKQLMDNLVFKKHCLIVPCFLEIKTGKVIGGKNAFDLTNMYGFILVAHLLYD